MSHSVGTDEDPPRKKRKTDSKYDLISNQPSFDIEDIFYSRQFYVLGHDAMRRMSSCNVLISGLGGLGVEISKNLILGGVGSITLHDTSLCSLKDLSSQYFLSRSDIGENRATTCCHLLSRLNTDVVVRTYTGDLTEESLRTFQVVVLTESSISEQLRVSSVTRQENTALVIASTRGLFGQIFCDFGEGFVILDTNGEPPASAMIVNVTKDSEGVVTCAENSCHGLEDGDFVTFSEVRGMVELNDCEPRQVRFLTSFSFSIGDTSSFSDYTRGGVFKQVKLQKVVNFKPLAQALEEPDFVVSDFGKPDHSRQLHLAFKTLDGFEQSHGRAPRPWNSEDASIFIELARSIDVNDSIHINLDMELFELFSKVSSGSVSPINSIIGGIAAQEVMKACSGKFSPIFQWFYFDAIECLPESKCVPEMDSQPTESRYDGQVAVFGKEFQNRLGSLKYFVVGAGAIGCELLKILAMMGVGEINRGALIVCDMDFVLKSNLNRQFLFRSQDLLKPKSSTAAKAIRKMNLNVNIIAHDVHAGPDMEDVFTDEFFESLDGVAVAVDNVETRKYIDRRCVYYRKPLLEAGTSGTKGSTQVVIPFLTESYNCSRDPGDKRIPFYTIHYFPYTIQHVITWARNRFDSLFKGFPNNVVQYLNNPNFFERFLMKFSHLDTLQILKSVKRGLVDERPLCFEDCVTWARNLWQDQYSNQIKKLLHDFPPGRLTTNGQRFWSAPKRRPRFLTFSPEDPLHFQFVFTAANLYASVYGIPQNRNRDFVAEIVSSINIEEFNPEDTSYLNSSCRAETGMSHETTVQLLYDLPPRDQFTELTIAPLKFDKDDTLNLHVDFIVAASNLRALNYGIAPTNHHQSRLIAGNITPAIATTSSVVAGLLALELIKLSQGHSTLQPFKNGFLNLSLPFFGFSTPVTPWKLKYYDHQWTIWDRFEIAGELTLEEFLNHFRDHHRLRVNLVHYGACVLYSEFLPRRRLQEIRALPMSRVVCKMNDSESLGPHVRALAFNIFCYDFDGNDVEVPYVRYSLPLEDDL